MYALRKNWARKIDFFGELIIIFEFNLESKISGKMMLFSIFSCFASLREGVHLNTAILFFLRDPTPPSIFIT